MNCEKSVQNWRSVSLIQNFSTQKVKFLKEKEKEKLIVDNCLVLWENSWENSRKTELFPPFYSHENENDFPKFSNKTRKIKENFV